LLPVAIIAVTGLRFKEGRILGANRQRELVFDRMKIDEITKDVATDRQQERVAAAFKAFEEIRAAEPDETFAGTGKVLHDRGFAIRRRSIQGRLDIVCKAVARKVEHPDRVDDRSGIELGILIIGIVVPDPEVERLGFTLGEMEPYATFQNKEASVRFSFWTGAR